MYSSGLRQSTDVDPRQWPLHSERPHFTAELLNLLKPGLALFLHGGNADEVLEHLCASLFLQEQGELHGAVQEVGDDLDVGLKHIAGGDSRRAETNPARHLRRCVARDSVF